MNGNGNSNRALGPLCVLALLACLGCGPASDRVGVTGIVKYQDGTPVDRGMIEFAPTAAGARGGGGATIAKGSYAVPREHGLPPGEYLVRIYSPTLVKADQDAPGPLGLAAPRERISKRYNVETELTAQVEGTTDLQLDFTVEPSSSQE